MNKFTPLVQDILGSCPSAGNGVHRWLFLTALKLHPRFPDKDELAVLLEMATANCGREVSADEIENAVRDSQRVIENPSARTQHARRWPTRNEKQIEVIVRDGLNLAELTALSPVQWSDGASHTEEIIDLLFPGNPLLCGGGRKESALTRTRAEWRGFLDKQQFIVPSPMLAVHGITKDGNRSMRSLSNTGPRRFLVVEFDQGDFDQHAAILNHLRQYAPLALAVHSGNKSLHGWFCCVGQPEEKVRKFFGYAVSLGADPATWTPCQFVRMPDGRRDSGKIQQALFFNPKVIPAV